jgi:hypothetical protein
MYFISREWFYNAKSIAILHLFSRSDSTGSQQPRQLARAGVKIKARKRINSIKYY